MESCLAVSLNSLNSVQVVCQKLHGVHHQTLLLMVSSLTTPLDLSSILLKAEN